MGIERTAAGRVLDGLVFGGCALFAASLTAAFLAQAILPRGALGDVSVALLVTGAFSGAISIAASFLFRPVAIAGLHVTRAVERRRALAPRDGDVAGGLTLRDPDRASGAVSLREGAGELTHLGENG